MYLLPTGRILAARGNFRSHCIQNERRHGQRCIYTYICIYIYILRSGIKKVGDSVAAPQYKLALLNLIEISFGGRVCLAATTRSFRRFHSDYEFLNVQTSFVRSFSRKRPARGFTSRSIINPFSFVRLFPLSLSLSLPLFHRSGLSAVASRSDSARKLHRGNWRPREWNDPSNGVEWPSNSRKNFSFPPCAI